MSLSHSQDVAVWGCKKIAHADEPDTAAWVVDHEENRTGLVWANEPMEGQIREKYGEDIQLSHCFGFNGTFVNGRPLIQLSKTITPCLGDNRPEELYRAVHDGQPYNGACSRSYPRGPEPLLFQVQLQKHMKWTCQAASPFMSATTNFQKAMDVSEGYAQRGHKGIKILVIDTMGNGWGTEQRIWHVATLMKDFDITVAHTRNTEYLITHSIPLQHVKTLMWPVLEHKGKNPNLIQYGTMTEPEEGWLQHERNQETARQAAEQADHTESSNEADVSKEAAGQAKRKRKRNQKDEAEEQAVPRRKGVRAKGFAPLKKRDVQGNAS
ncbi:hypothetical protein PG985_007002 [Apiospora marii]|uniref:DUF7587 domain-containing protein n=1 Tax=Apiospora marii TaxID=335849 RepID=A0ABR1SFB7_9PEZI